MNFRYSPLPEEGQILKSILMGETLAVTLNKLCTLVDVQVGNVVSLVCLAGAEDGFAQSIAQTARQFSLNVYLSMDIISPDHNLLGSFQVYSLNRRRPAPRDLQLIGRVTHLAAIALQRHSDALNIELNDRNLDSPPDCSPTDRPSFIN